MSAIFSACGAKESFNGWEFTCVNTENEPVSGVKIQICSDSICQMIESNEDGIARFSGKERSYECHIEAIPDNYIVKEDAPKKLTGDNKSLVITLQHSSTSIR